MKATKSTHPHLPISPGRARLLGLGIALAGLVVGVFVLVNAPAIPSGRPDGWTIITQNLRTLYLIGGASLIVFGGVWGVMFCALAIFEDALLDIQQKISRA